MKKKLIDELKLKLEKEKEIIEKELEKFAKRNPKIKGDWQTVFPQFGTHTSEQDENADEVEEYVTELPIEYSLESRLKDIEEALEKIKKNKYGTCEKCKKAISIQRLNACPEAKLCRKCQK